MSATAWVWLVVRDGDVTRHYTRKDAEEKARMLCEEFGGEAEVAQVSSVFRSKTQVVVEQHPNSEWVNP